MERVSGWYRRRAQGMLLAFGVILAVGLNVNAITVAQRLWTAAPLRAALIQQAQRAAPPSANDKQAVESALSNVESGLATISGLSLPIGWGKDVRPATWYVAASGWLLTAIAVSLGAPFWFDLLGRVAQLRTTGARPATNPSPPGTPPGTAPGATATTGWLRGRRLSGLSGHRWSPAPSLPGAGARAPGDSFSDTPIPVHGSTSAVP